MSKISECTYPIRKKRPDIFRRIYAKLTGGHIVILYPKINKYEGPCFRVAYYNPKDGTYETYSDNMFNIGHLILDKDGNIHKDSWTTYFAHGWRLWTGGAVVWND